MTAALWKSLTFGVVLAGSIGPIALLILGTAARQGFSAGAFAGLGAALADLIYAFIAFSLGAVVLPLLDAHAGAIQSGCALLLCGLGLSMLLQAGRQAAPTAIARPAAHAFLPTFLLTMVNPMTLVVFAGFVPQLPLAGSFGNAAWLALALFAGSLLVQFALAAAGAAFGAARPAPTWRRAINLAAGAGILAFGVAGLAAALDGTA